MGLKKNKQTQYMKVKIIIVRENVNKLRQQKSSVPSQYLNQWWPAYD